MKNNQSLKFKKFFGLPKDEIPAAVIISPFFSPKDFKNKLKKVNFFKGLIYKGVQGIYKDKKIIFINTGMGGLFVSDCVKALSICGVKAIIFLGAVGALKNIDICDNVLIKKTILDAECFYDIGISLNGDILKSGVLAADDLVNRCLSIVKEKGLSLKSVTNISLNSLWNQPKEKAIKIKENGIESVDLECFHFYAAAREKKISCVSLCFVSDNLLTDPFWRQLVISERLKMKSAQDSLVELALEVCV